MQQYQSNEIDKLMQALMAAHIDYGVIIEKDKKGHKNTYASLPCVLDSIHQLCSKQGLILTQASRIVDGQAALETILRHPASGQWISSLSLLTPNESNSGMSADQAWGGSSTYHRRYDAMALLGIASADDPADHDGNASTSYSNTINDKQLALLQSKLRTQPHREKDLLEAYGITELKQLPWKKMDEVIKILDTPRKG